MSQYHCVIQDEAGWGIFLVPIQDRDRWVAVLERYSMGKDLTEIEINYLESKRIGSVFELQFRDPSVIGDGA
jgi:hypothetical protein